MTHRDPIECHYDLATAGNPIRDFDFIAFRDPGGLQGRGPTRAAAIADLLELEAEQ